MAHDYEDVHGIGDMTDDELRSLVRQKLRDHSGIEAATIRVSVEDGIVLLGGRVGTDEERRIAEHIVTDELGLEQVENEILIDGARRAESPGAIDDHLASEDDTDGLLLGDRPVPLSPEAEHLDDELNEEIDSFGTTDVSASIERAAPWIPPERPTPEGRRGDDMEPPSHSDRH